MNLQTLSYQAVKFTRGALDFLHWALQPSIPQHFEQHNPNPAAQPRTGFQKMKDLPLIVLFPCHAVPWHLYFRHNPSLSQPTQRGSSKSLTMATQSLTGSRAPHLLTSYFCRTADSWCCNGHMLCSTGNFLYKAFTVTMSPSLLHHSSSWSTEYFAFPSLIPWKAKENSHSRGKKYLKQILVYFLLKFFCSTHFSC